METVKLKAKTKDYIWGGKRLFNYGKVSDTDIIAESWELKKVDFVNIDEMPDTKQIADEAVNDAVARISSQELVELIHIQLPVPTTTRLPCCRRSIPTSILSTRCSSTSTRAPTAPPTPLCWWWVS